MYESIVKQCGQNYVYRIINDLGTLFQFLKNREIEAPVKELKPPPKPPKILVSSTKASPLPPKGNSLAILSDKMPLVL